MNIYSLSFERYYLCRLNDMCIGVRTTTNLGLYYKKSSKFDTEGSRRQ